MNIKTYDYLFLFRFILALGIVWHEMHPPAVFYSIPINVPGRIIVWLFYTLSGYSISKGFYNNKYDMTWWGGGIASFYWNRLIRILPLFYLSYFTVNLFDTDASQIIPFLSWETMQDLFLIHYWFDLHSLTHAWFLGPLVQLYFISPLIFWLIRKFELESNPLRFLVYVAIMGVFIKYFSSLLNFWVFEGWSKSFDDRTMIGNLGIFLIGWTLVPLEKKYLSTSIKSSKLMGLIILATLVLLLCSISYYLPITKVLFWYLPTSTIVGFCGIIFIVVCNQGTLKRIQSGHVDSWNKYKFIFFYYLGSISYGIYLWRPIGQNIIINIDPYYQDNYLHFVCAFFFIALITILISLVTFYLFERRFSCLKQKNSLSSC